MSLIANNRKFDHSDFLANPKKYELFQIARVASHVFTDNGTDDLEEGRYVSVQFMRTAYNGIRRRVEPVYSVTADGKVWGVMYASNLANFLL